MKSAFEQLGIPLRLVISEEEIRAAYREKAQVLHPDHGGSEEGFSALATAQATLLSPVLRLAEWAKARGAELERRGAMAVELMDLFERVSAALQQAEAVARQREGAKSALVLALTESAAHQAREKIEQVLGEVHAAMAGEIAHFPEFECGSGDVSMTFRHLVFVEKWQGHLRQMFGRLL